jgi:hypothetical protein
MAGGSGNDLARPQQPEQHVRMAPRHAARFTTAAQLAGGDKRSTGSRRSNSAPSREHHHSSSAEQEEDDDAEQRDHLESTVTHDVKPGEAAGGGHGGADAMLEAQQMVKQLFDVNGRMRERQQRIGELLTEQSMDQHFERKVLTGLGQQLASLPTSLTAQGAKGATATAGNDAAAAAKANNKWNAKMALAQREFDDEHGKQDDMLRELQAQYAAAVAQVESLQKDLELQRHAAAALLKDPEALEKYRVCWSSMRTCRRSQRPKPL